MCAERLTLLQNCESRVWFGYNKVAGKAVRETVEWDQMILQVTAN